MHSVMKKKKEIEGKKKRDEKNNKHIMSLFAHNIIRIITFMSTVFFL